MHGPKKRSFADRQSAVQGNHLMHFGRDGCLRVVTRHKPLAVPLAVIEEGFTSCLLDCLQYPVRTDCDLPLTTILEALRPWRGLLSDAMNLELPTPPRAVHRISAAEGLLLSDRRLWIQSATGRHLAADAAFERIAWLPVALDLSMRVSPPPLKDLILALAALSPSSRSQTTHQGSVSQF